MISLSPVFSQHTQNFTYIFSIQIRLHLRKRFPCQVHIQQIVVAQIHQIRQSPPLRHGQAFLESLKEPLNEKIVFQQTASATPFELAEFTLSNEYFGH
jgi:hypothetical protein